MKEGSASHTARSVAAHRLTYDRVAAGYGDPAAGGTLAISVSTSTSTPATRARFQARVAELGEPARTVLTVADAAGRRRLRHRLPRRQLTPAVSGIGEPGAARLDGPAPAAKTVDEVWG